MALAAALTAMRGFTVAGMVGGRYPLGSLVADTGLLAVLLLLAGLLDRGLRRVIEGPASPSRSRGGPGRALGFVARAAVLLLVVVPPLLVTLKADAELDLFDAVVVDSTFASVESAAREAFLWPFGPTAGPMWQLGRAWAWLLTGEDLADHRPIDYVRRRPGRRLLIIHGDQDRTLAVEGAQLLYAAARSVAAEPGAAELWIVLGEGHIPALHRADYGHRLARFLAGVAH